MTDEANAQEKAMQTLSHLKDGESVSQADALETLAAISDPGMRRVIDSLTSQVQRGYDGLCYHLGPEETPSEVYLFSDHAFASGFRLAFNRLVEAAHPEYHSISSSWNQVEFERSRVSTERKR